MRNSKAQASNSDPGSGQRAIARSAAGDVPLNKLYVTDVSLADLLDTSRSTIWRYVKAGILPPPIKIGALTRFDVLDVLTALKSDASGMSQDRPTKLAEREG